MKQADNGQREHLLSSHWADAVNCIQDQHFRDYFRRKFEEHVKDNERFRFFLSRYEQEYVGRIRDQAHSVRHLMNIRWELAVAAWMCRHDYEPEHPEEEENTRMPDFRLELPTGTLCVEVTRFGETLAESRERRALAELTELIRVRIAPTINCDFYCTRTLPACIGVLPKVNDIITGMANAIADRVKDCSDSIPGCPASLEENVQVQWCCPKHSECDLKGEWSSSSAEIPCGVFNSFCFSLKLSRVKSSVDHNIVHCPAYSLPQSNQHPSYFAERLKGKLSQLCPAAPNILLIWGGQGFSYPASDLLAAFEPSQATTLAAIMILSRSPFRDTNGSVWNRSCEMKVPDGCRDLLSSGSLEELRRCYV